MLIYDDNILMSTSNTCAEKRENEEKEKTMFSMFVHKQGIS